jgi:hypothetical protein
MRKLVVVFGLSALLAGCTGLTVERYVSSRECAVAGAIDPVTCDRLIAAAIDQYYTSTRRYQSFHACVAAVDGTCHLVRQRKQRAGLSHAALCERQSDGRYIPRPIAFEVALGPRPRAWALAPGQASPGKRRSGSLLSFAYALLEST